MLFEAERRSRAFPSGVASYVWQAMYYVYLIRSECQPTQTYIGQTADLKKRMASHNSGANTHTSKFRPWKLVCYTAFDKKDKAIAFEKYLKAGSGHAFANRHFW